MENAASDARREETQHTDTIAQRTVRPRLAIILVAALSGLALSLVLYVGTAIRDRQLEETQFNLDAGLRVEAIGRAVANRLVIADMLIAFYEGSESVAQEEFRTFARLTLAKYPGTHSLAWVSRVDAAERDAFVRAVHASGRPDYRITQERGEEFAPGGELVPAAERSAYFPILFHEPDSPGYRLLGFDLATVPAFKSAIDRAIASRKATTVLRPPLDGHSTRAQELYVLAAAAEKASLLGADRRAAHGLAMGAFDIDRIVEDALAYYQPTMSVYIFDASSGSAAPVYAHVIDSAATVGEGESGVAAAANPAVHVRRAVNVADRVWTIECVPSADYLAAHRIHRALVVLLAGLAGTVVLVGGLVALTDWTLRVERRVAQRTSELRESEQRFRRLVENAGDAFFLRDEQRKIVDVNKRACDSLGYSREELLTMSVDDLDPTFVPRNLVRYSALPDEEYPVTFEGLHRRKDGTTFPVELRLAPVYIGGRRFMLSLARDVTERKRSEQALQKERRLLRDLLNLHEHDRQLMAYEIHDGLAQLLTGAHYKFQSVAHLERENPAAAAAAFDEAVRLLAEGIVEARRLISGLRPPILDESGVVAAVEFLICERQSDCPHIEFEHDVRFDRLAGPLESSIFRIIQESLTNACRYSQSDRIRVQLRQIEDRVQVCVQDWGVGFDAAKVAGDHFGLRGIRERARLLGGKATIETAPSEGTRVTVELPVVSQPTNGTDNGDRLQ